MATHEQLSSELYTGREQSLVKHTVLEEYLLEFALKVGDYYPSITYVDGFSGPWMEKSQKLEDTSFHIALAKLRQARGKLAQRNKQLKLRCLFIEANPTAYGKLKAFAERPENHDVEIVALNSEFEDAIPDVLKFVRADSQTFPFFFIDPTGWTGFAMKTIQPILQLNPSEVLVNFMTGHIRRFIEAPEQDRQDEFRDLFGSDEFKELPPALFGQEREDWIVQTYMECIKRTGAFKFVCAAMVLKPEIDATHFHLIYATRHWKGVEVFKKTERKAMEVQEEARAKAQQRKREYQGCNTELPFEPKVLAKTSHYDSLRVRYLGAAHWLVESRLAQDGSLDYDQAWIMTQLRPLVWVSDLKKWIETWQAEKCLRVDGLVGKARVPQFGERHRLVWLEGRHRS
jgi:three-Cys-motif partner protein